MGNAGQPLGIIGQRVGLLVVQHLDAVLDAAQEPIGLRQKIASRFVEPTLNHQRIQHGQRLPAAQIDIAAAGDELLRLHEELDLADAATAQLDVVAGDGDLAMPLVGVNLPLDRMDVADGGVIQILAPDIGLELGQKVLAGRDVAGRRPRLDHGRPFPVLAGALVVDQRRRRRHGDRRRTGVGPEPQVGAEDT